MPTPLDRALDSRNAFVAFAGLVTAVAAWSIWNGEIFPAEKDPSGDPAGWTDEELRRWLRARELLPSDNSSQEELLKRVRANMRPPPRS